MLCKTSISKRLFLFILSILMAFIMTACQSRNEGKTVNPTATPEPAQEMAQRISEGNEEQPEPTELETIEPMNTSDTTSKTLQEDATQMSDEPSSTLDQIIEDDLDGLTDTQKNSINMLNYMSVLAQRISEDKGNQLFLESAYSSLVNDIYPNAVDNRTQAQITSLMDTIQEYRMIAVKRKRLQFIYDQNCAQALRKAIPNPVGLLSVVHAATPLQAAASVLYMAIDSISSYASATSQADLQFIKDGWELDDKESAQLHASTKAELTYLLNMVRDYDFPGDYSLNEETVQDFITWSNKPDSQLVAKISWFNSHEDAYAKFGPYWLELVKDYYNAGDYAKCLEAIQRYEKVSTRIFRKDLDYAKALPMAIIAAKETLSEEEYIALSDKFCKTIIANTKDENWSLRYFAAQVYINLYSLTNEEAYYQSAYKLAYDNIVNLVDAQLELNASYLAPVVEQKPANDASKREKDEINKYNRFIKNERRTALPPVNEALYLNCALLFALDENQPFSESERSKIDAILHVNGEKLFLTQALDDLFWFGNHDSNINASDLNVSFKDGKLTLPACLVTDRSEIIVTVSTSNKMQRLENWNVEEVTRPKGSNDVSLFQVKYICPDLQKFKFADGDRVSVKVMPIAESKTTFIEFNFECVSTRKFGMIEDLSFERK